MGKKRKHQGDPANIFSEKKVKGQPKRKRRKLSHQNDEKTNKFVKNTIVDESMDDISYEDEVDIDTSSASFLQQLDPSELSIIPGYDHVYIA